MTIIDLQDVATTKVGKFKPNNHYPLITVINAHNVMMIIMHILYIILNLFQISSGLAPLYLQYLSFCTTLINLDEYGLQ